MSSISSLSSAGARPTQNAYETMTSQDFLRVMFTELTRQDPTKPTDSKDLLAQLGSIRSIESDVSLTNKLESIAKQNEIGSASNLVGAFVEGRTAQGKEARGFVDSISVTREGVVLNLSTEVSIPFSGLDRVYDPSLITTTPPATTGTSQRASGAVAPAADRSTPESSELLDLISSLQEGART